MAAPENLDDIPDDGWGKVEAGEDSEAVRCFELGASVELAFALVCMEIDIEDSNVGVCDLFCKE